MSRRNPPLLFLALLVITFIAPGLTRSEEPIDLVVCGNQYSKDHPWSWEHIAERHGELLNNNEFHDIRVLLYKQFMESEKQNVNVLLKNKIAQIL